MLYRAIFTLSPKKIIRLSRMDPHSLIGIVHLSTMLIVVKYNAPVYQYQYSNIDISTDNEWIEHKENTENFLNGVISRLKDNVVHIFPLSQIPLLVEMGYILQNDNNNIKIYQFSDNEKWVLDYDKAEILPLTVEYITPTTKTKKLIVVLEISNKVDTNDIDFHVSTFENSVLRFTIVDPLRYKVMYESQVKDIKRKIRSETEKYINDYDEIHLFAAMPAGLSIEIGRCILRSMWPKVFLYNYRRSNNQNINLHLALINTNMNTTVENWKNKLLDLCKQNRLLNYRDTKHSNS